MEKNIYRALNTTLDVYKRQAFLQPLLVSIVDRIHQRSPCLVGDGMEGVVIHRLAVFLIGLLGHGDEAPLVLSLIHI